MKGHKLAWIVVLLLALWIFHVHYLRGVPVKRQKR